MSPNWAIRIYYEPRRGGAGAGEGVDSRCSWAEATPPRQGGTPPGVPRRARQAYLGAAGGY